MKSALATIVLLPVILLTGCAAQVVQSLPELEQDYISLEVTAEEGELSFWDVPYREQPSINKSPIDRNDGVVVGTLGIDGGNADELIVLAREIGLGEHGDFDSLLIAHKGKLLLESYYLRGRVNLTHPQVSATKSYTSFALGRAIQLGYLSMEDLEKPLGHFLKNLNPDRFVAGVENITLHRALTMQSGIRIPDEQKQEFVEASQELQGEALVQAYFAQSTPVTSESQNFLYQDVDPILVMQVLNAVVPSSAKEFIKKELFDKLGISTYSWQTDASGLPRAGDRASITSRAMLKFGQLASNEGKLNGEQLIPKAFVNKATNRIISTSDEDAFNDSERLSNSGYGYYWWQADMKVGTERYFSTSAQGGGGQYIILIEALDLIVVATAHDADVKTLQVVAERILPAFVD